MTELVPWLDLIKTGSLKVAFLFCFGALVLLFSPDGWIQRMGLLGFRNGNRANIGFALLACAGLLLFELLVKLGAPFKEQGMGIIRRFRIRKRCQKLAPNEQAVLQSYIERRTRVQNFDRRHPVVLVLVRDGILVQIGDVGDFRGWSFQIDEAAWKYLNDNPEMVGLPGGSRPRQDEPPVGPPVPE